MSVWVIVLAGGGGNRFGAPKQFSVVGQERLVERVVRVAWSVAAGVVVALPRGVKWNGDPGVVAVTGGTTRAGSVRAGLSAVPVDADIVVIHDAAHPLASAKLFRAVAGAVAAGAAAVVPAVEATEALVHAPHGAVADRLDKRGVMLVQMPQAFRAGVLRRLHRGAPEDVEDSGLAHRHGYDVVVLPGDPANLHITTARELAMAERLVDLTE